MASSQNPLLTLAELDSAAKEVLADDAGLRAILENSPDLAAAVQGKERAQKVQSLYTETDNIVALTHWVNATMQEIKRLVRVFDDPSLTFALSQIEPTLRDLKRDLRSYDRFP